MKTSFKQVLGFLAAILAAIGIGEIVFAAGSSAQSEPDIVYTKCTSCNSDDGHQCERLAPHPDQLHLHTVNGVNFPVEWR